ncbi:MAG: Spermine synthase [Candidatus Saccharibacteria bacterium]|nr:Spermine synthase [Candidatus Saccharibacteria bacterium]
MTDTDLEHYQVVERVYEGRPARVLFSGPRRAAQSGIGLDDDPDLLFDYNQRLLEVANGVYPQRILVIGGGAFTLPMALTAALPEAIVDVVELDPGLRAIAAEHFGLTESERLDISFGDGREFVEQSNQLYDLIVLDVFSELSIPRQFLTIEFVRKLHARLQPGGTVAMNIIASYQGINAGLIKSQVAAYQSLFDRLDIFPAAYGLTSWLPQNLLLVAQKNADRVLDEYLRFAPIDSIEAGEIDLYHD